MQSSTVQVIPQDRPFSLSERDWELCEKAITFFFVGGNQLTAHYLAHLVYQCSPLYEPSELSRAIRIHRRLSEIGG